MDENRLATIITQIVGEAGLELIEYKLFTQGETTVVRCEVDYPSGGVTMDICAKVNRAVVESIENEGLIDDFLVEINSPGITRKLKDEKDLKRCIGREVDVFFKEKTEMANLSGKIIDVLDSTLVLDVDGNEKRIKINEMKYAKEQIVF